MFFCGPEEEELMAKRQEVGGQESIDRLKEQIAHCERDLQRQVWSLFQ